MGPRVTPGGPAAVAATTIDRKVPPATFSASVTVKMIASFKTGSVVASKRTPVGLTVVIARADPAARPTGYRVEVNVDYFFVVHGYECGNAPGTAATNFGRGSAGRPTSRWISWRAPIG